MIKEKIGPNNMDQNPKTKIEIEIEKEERLKKQNIAHVAGINSIDEIKSVDDEEKEEAKKFIVDKATENYKKQQETREYIEKLDAEDFFKTVAQDELAVEIANFIEEINDKREINKDNRRYGVSLFDDENEEHKKQCEKEGTELIIGLKNKLESIIKSFIEKKGYYPEKLSGDINISLKENGKICEIYLNDKYYLGKTKSHSSLTSETIDSGFYLRTDLRYEYPDS